MAIYCKWIHNHKTDAHNVLMRIYMHNSQIMHCDTLRCHLILLEFIHIDSNNKVIQILPRKKRVYSFRLEICWQHAKDIGQSASHWDQDATMKSWSVCMQTRSPYEYTFSVQKKIFRRITNRDEKNQPKKKIPKKGTQNAKSPCWYIFFKFFLHGNILVSVVFQRKITDIGTQDLTK